MRRLADLISALGQSDADRPALVAAYLAQGAAAEALLCGPAPKRLIPPATLRDWIAGESGLPDWLIDASTAATGDAAEALALILPAAAPPKPDPAEPDLPEVLADLAALPPGPLARAAILSMARRLPPEARALYFRLITGTYRAPVSAAVLAQARNLMAGLPASSSAAQHRILAVMIYAEAALATGARGPQITLALRHDNRLVPITRLRASLPAAQTTALMVWIRAHATGRFGPLRAVPARQVFRLGFSALTPNRRRLSGVTLTDPRILDWLPDRDPADADPLASLTALLPNTA